MPAPTNISDATATPLDWGTLTQDVSGASGPRWEVWYSYVGKTNEHGILISATSSGAYVPRYTVYTGSVGSLTVLGASNFFGGHAFPVTPAVTIWIKVEQSDSGVTPDNDLAMTITKAPSGTVTSGQLVAWSRAGVLDLTIAMNPATAAVTRVFGNGYPGIECAVMPSTGNVLVGTYDTSNCTLFDKNLQLITTVATTWGATTRRGAITAVGSSFYVMAESTLGRTLYQVSSTGTILDSWTGMTVVSMGGVVSADETTMYFLTTPFGTIGRYDLVSRAMISSLATGVTGPFGPMLVLPDGTLAVSHGWLIEQYDTTSGSILQTYTLTQNVYAMAPSQDNTTFWAQTQTGASFANHKYWHIRISDGVVLDDFEIPYSPRLTTVTIGFGPSIFSPFYESTTSGGPLEDILVVGRHTTVRAERVVSFGLDDGVHVDDEAGTFYNHGKTVLDGEVTISGDVTFGGSGAGITDISAALDGLGT